MVVLGTLRFLGRIGQQLVARSVVCQRSVARLRSTARLLARTSNRSYGAE